MLEMQEHASGLLVRSTFRRTVDRGRNRNCERHVAESLQPLLNSQRVRRPEMPYITMKLFIVSVACVAIFSVSDAAATREPPSLHDALEQLVRDGRFSGAVVIRDARGVRFAQGYGLADPFSGRRFTPDTPVDSASLSKPVTAAGVLLLANAGKLDLDALVRRYLPGYPHEQTTVRHLLSH